MTRAAAVAMPVAVEPAGTATKVGQQEADLVARRGVDAEAAGGAQMAAGRLAVEAVRA